MLFYDTNPKMVGLSLWVETYDEDVDALGYKREGNEEAVTVV